MSFVSRLLLHYVYEVFSDNQLFYYVTNEFRQLEENQLITNERGLR